MSRSGDNFGHPSWVRQREFRHRLPMGHSDAFYKGLYSSIARCHFRDGPGISVHGGIYSMDFSPDGCLFAATWHRNGLQLYDPLCRNLIETIGHAHRGRVKKVKFLDARTFASGSADMSVAIWDVRNLTEQVLSLRGHSNTVCNIEFSPENDTVLSCGGDGMIHAWNLNNLTEESVVCKKVFGSHDFLRMRLSPDASKMVISSSRGYLLVVHDLELRTLAEDLAGYYPGACPMHHLRERVACGHVDVYSRRRRRNRVEPVTDFPAAGGCGAVAVSALEVHPEGASALSRSAGDGEGKALQWLCVHDIRARARDGDGDGDVARLWRGAAPPDPDGGEEELRGARGGSGQGESATGSLVGSMASVTLNAGESSRAESERGGGGAGGRADSQGPAAAPEPASPPELAFEFDFDIGCPVDSSSPKSLPEERRTLPRLTHYAESTSNGMLCSEELCFSPDGRLVCSPFDNGIQLHTFSPECCGEFVSWSGGEAIPLHELATHSYHDTIVISTRFSPRHCLIVSGCLEGKINWYQPVL